MLEQIDSRVASLGYKSFAKYDLDLIQRDIDKAQAEGSLRQEKVVTPQGQYDNLVSELARIRGRLGIKFDVMRFIVKKILKLKPMDEKDVEPTINSLWDYISVKNGFVQFKGKFEGKGYPIERKDVDLLGTYMMKQCHARALRAQLKAQA
jgi:hypothetical protein